MKKYLIEYFSIVLIVFSFIIFKENLASYLLTDELSSDEKVNEIISFANQPADYLSFPIFNNQRLKKSPDIFPLIALNESGFDNVLGDTSDKWIEVNLSQQRVNAWEGKNQAFNFLVSTGKWAPTPVGNFNIWIKLRSTTMSGGSKALGTYYYLPNVPCVMYFYKGYGLHGTYWHNNFGQPMSHGCVNLKTSDACALFDWASVGTKVSIHY